MASFIIHTIIGEHFLNELEKAYNIELSENDRKQFLLGNLVVDTLKTDKTIPNNIPESEITNYKMNIKNKIRQEKLSTHFRNPSSEGECIKTPVPELFLNKYNHLIDDNICVLGYLFHLYTDKLFFSKLFTESFDTIDEHGNLVTLDKDLASIRIRKANKVVDAKEFWAGTSSINIYRDYTIMNKILLERIGTSLDPIAFSEYAKENFINPGIEEVSFENIQKVLQDTEKYIEESYFIEDTTLQVFSENQIIDFVSYVVEQFMLEYKSILDKFEEVKKKLK